MPSAQNDNSPIKIGLIGCGVVGGGTVITLLDNADSIERQLGVPLEIARVCVRDPKKDRGLPLPADVYTADVNAVLDDPEIQIIAELMGGVDPAGDYVRRALRSGKHVVTANKELIAKEGDSLRAEARERGVDLEYGASVAGGIPIIRALKMSLAAERVDELMGIVNGTTNYILTKMTNEGVGFEETLAEAQEKGYAEADPTDDVDGHDAAYKLAILASLAFRTPVDIDQVYREGIRGITDRDIAYARELGYVIKLVALGKAHDGEIEVRVHPALLPDSHPLASVNDVFNAVFVKGSSVDEVMFYGRGAGGLPTGSAVSADILDVARNIRAGSSGRVHLDFGKPKRVVPMADVRSRYFFRLQTADRPGMLAGIAGIFGEHQVSLDAIIQKASEADVAELVFVTHETREGDIRDALAKIGKLEAVPEIGTLIRVEA